MTRKSFHYRRRPPFYSLYQVFSFNLLRNASQEYLSGYGLLKGSVGRNMGSFYIRSTLSFAM